jgi:hypothetical protein
MSISLPSLAPQVLPKSFFKPCQRILGAFRRRDDALPGIWRRAKRQIDNGDAQY